MNLQDFMKVLRTRWISVVVTTLIVVLAALAYTLVSTPMYEASVRLFVSTTAGASNSDLYQGNRLSQERVLSYTELLTGETLAQRTIDKLGLDMNAEELQSRVRASAKPDTVLIDVDVRDESPVRARDIANSLADEFVILVRELETPEGSAKAEARVVVEQRAALPTAPVSPQKVRNILAGFGLGLLLGVGVAVVRDKLDNTIKSRERLEELTGVGVVGSIPTDKHRRKEAAIQFAAESSPIAEAFRKLRTNLQFLAVDNPPRAIVVTSSLPSEGKSTTAINLALVLAESDHNVVLVDGDMRRPTLAKYLGLIQNAGLSTVLSGQAALSEILQETRFPGLTVLTSGAVPPNPSELLGSQAARNLLQELKAKFDYVIIDSSPLLAVTDGAILAANSDGVLMIGRYGQTKRDQLSHAVANLSDVGARLLGAVITMTPERGGEGYHYDYGYYGSGSHSTESSTRPTEASNSAALSSDQRTGS